eukprot:sb/3472249/
MISRFRLFLTTNPCTKSANLRFKTLVWPVVIHYPHLSIFLPLFLISHSPHQAVLYAQWKTLLFSVALYVLGGLGITAGAHRLWAHKSYKATPLLRTFLMLCQTLAGQDDLYQWSRDHRVHHKWSETNADPYNANRGISQWPKNPQPNEFMVSTVGPRFRDTLGEKAPVH